MNSYIDYPLTWQESYSVGNAELDDQHKKLLQLCNRVSQCKQDNSPESISNFHLILNDLAAYANIHFRIEESMLAQAKYPLLDEQIKEHTAYSESIAEFLFSATMGMIDKDGLAQYLEIWWIKHILDSDMQYKSLLAPKQSGHY